MTILAARILGAALLLGVAGLVLLAVLERPVPDPLSLLIASATAGLLGLVAPAPRSSS